MLRRVGNLLKYWVERVLVRGIHVRLAIMASVIGLFSLCGGLAVISVGGDPEGPAHAIWWAFLRLTDPGYLGDDVGVGPRVVSTILTVAGYVLFMGSLVAIMTQWLNDKIRVLEGGYTPIVMRDHIVIVGLTSRTVPIAREMFQTVARVQRFLAKHETRNLRLVFLLEELDARVRQQIRQRVGHLWRERQVVMRSGSPMHIEELARADFANSAAVLLPAEDVGSGEVDSDARTIKTLLAMGQELRQMPFDAKPLVVTEVFDVRKLSIARRAYDGPLELIGSDQLIGRLLALTVLHPTVSLTFEELLTYDAGNEIHVTEPPGQEGKTFDEIRRSLPRAICLGYVRPDRRSFESLLCPDPSEPFCEGYRLVTLARSHRDALPDATPSLSCDLPPLDLVNDDEPAVGRVLILGWSDRIPDLISELSSHHTGSFDVDIVSEVGAAVREESLKDHDLGQARVQNIKAEVLRARAIAECLKTPYDRIVLVASDWLTTGAKSDARTVVAYLLVHDELARLGRSTPIAVELMDESNRALFDHPGVEVIVSPLIIGRMLAHVTLRQELRAIYEDLFDAHGPAVRLRSARSYGVPAGPMTFGEVERALQESGDLLMGIRTGPDTLELNPDRSRAYEDISEVKLVVLGRYRGA